MARSLLLRNVVSGGLMRGLALGGASEGLETGVCELCTHISLYFGQKVIRLYTDPA